VAIRRWSSAATSRYFEGVNAVTADAPSRWAGSQPRASVGRSSAGVSLPSLGQRDDVGDLGDLLLGKHHGSLTSTDSDQALVT
jgi:hypothetical protein